MLIEYSFRLYSLLRKTAKEAVKRHGRYLGVLVGEGSNVVPGISRQYNSIKRNLSCVHISRIMCRTATTTKGTE